MNFVRFYQRSLQQRPYLTQICSTGILMASGDIISQTCVEKRKWKDFDVRRTGRFSLIGMLFIAPTVVTWYRFLARNVTGSKRTIPLKMVLLDQLLFSPCFLSIMLCLLRKLEGASSREIADAWRRDFLPIFTTGLMIWPAVQTANFYLVPLDYRLLLVQFVSLFWNTYLAYKTQAKHIEMAHKLESHDALRSPY